MSSTASTALKHRTSDASISIAKKTSGYEDITGRSDPGAQGNPVDSGLNSPRNNIGDYNNLRFLLKRKEIDDNRHNEELAQRLASAQAYIQELKAIVTKQAAEIEALKHGKHTNRILAEKEINLPKIKFAGVYKPKPSNEKAAEEERLLELKHPGRRIVYGEPIEILRRDYSGYNFTQKELRVHDPELFDSARKKISYLNSKEGRAAWEVYKKRYSAPPTSFNELVPPSIEKPKYPKELEKELLQGLTREQIAAGARAQTRESVRKTRDKYKEKS